MMYKVFLRYPEALRPAFPKLKEKLEDADPGKNAAFSHSPIHYAANEAIMQHCIYSRCPISGS